jgi:hypothetical protein
VAHLEHVLGVLTHALAVGLVVPKIDVVEHLAIRLNVHHNSLVAFQQLHI